MTSTSTSSALATPRHLDAGAPPDGSGSCLVTGGSGFIGRRLIDRLERSGRFRRVINLDVVPDGRDDFVAGDLRDPDVGRDLPTDVLTHCVHLAALAKEPGFEHHEYFDVNHLGTRHLLDLCERLGIGSVVFTSTMMVFPAGDVRYAEGDQVAPDTAYGTSKALAELELRRWLAGADRRGVIVRPGVVFGPGDEGNFERLRRMLARRMFFYVGRRQTVKSSVHVDDVVGLLAHLLDAPAGPDLVHAVFPEPTTIEDTVEGIFGAFGGRYQVPVVPFARARAAAVPFGWLEERGLRTGIHPRRIEKLYRSTDISAASLAEVGYELVHPDVASACRAWAAAVDPTTGAPIATARAAAVPA